ncbi:MAG: hypothetical protein EHM85_02870 [Desulfobacteraceae bacterium]|nr:MAG: hypothetical protein EHM85_02870 [Desulfobacteraceae bacterium]
MENIKRMLGEMVKKNLIIPAVEKFLLRFFISRMNLKCDIKEEYIAYAISEMASTNFGSGLNLNDKFLTGKFKDLAVNLIAEGAFDKSLSSSDLSKMFFVFCQVHDATIARN